MIGARVIKTCIAVTLSILIAQSFDLYTFQFAGVIAVLSVQPSIHRSFRNLIQLIVSAVLGVLLGVLAWSTMSASFIAMGIVTFLLMVFHVKMKWTNTLLAAVVIGINTIGTVGLDLWDAAWNQMALVIIGTGTGIIVNLFRMPVNQDRAESYVEKSDKMIQVLLNYILLDLENQRFTPYPVMKEQIDEISLYIKKGKEVASLAKEDRKYQRIRFVDISKILSSFDVMLEKIREMSMSLENAEIIDGELRFSKKLLKLVMRMQENIVQGKLINLKHLERVLDIKRNQMWVNTEGQEDASKLSDYHKFYGHVIDYMSELTLFAVEHSGQSKSWLIYTSIDRPGLLAEISNLMLKNGLNITDVRMSVNGEFAETEIEVAYRFEVDFKLLVKQITNMDSVIEVEMK